MVFTDESIVVKIRHTVLVFGLNAFVYVEEGCLTFLEFFEGFFSVVVFYASEVFEVVH